jgi:hypothetical protein
MAQSYVDFRMQEWGMEAASKRFQRILRRVLNELYPGSLVLLKDPRLEVRVVSDPVEATAWAYFPVHRRRLIAQELKPKAQTRVLLVLNGLHFEDYRVAYVMDCFRDALGHVLLYLRSPKAQNECSDAMREWRACAWRPQELEEFARLRRDAAKRSASSRRKKAAGNGR